MIGGTPSDIIRRYVLDTTGDGYGRYLKLLHGNLLTLLPADRRGEFIDALVRDAREIEDEALSLMLHEPNWRPRLVAAWLVGVSRRAQFRQRIGELLLASELTYAGQGYCFALAALGGDEDARILIEDLDRYLPHVDLRYDQHWAMAALVHLDSVRGTQDAAAFLAPEGLWQPWATRYPNHPVDFENLRSRIADACVLQ